MGIPDFQAVMRPLLQQLADGREHTLHDLREALLNLVNSSISYYEGGNRTSARP